MRYLKRFNESSITDENMYNILHLLLPLIDNFNLEEVENSNNNHIIYYNSNDRISIEINKNKWLFDQYCYSIKVQTKINKQFGKDVYDINNTELAEYLDDAIESCREILDAKEVVMGYFNNCFSVFFLKEKANYKRYKDVDIYGENAIVELSNGGFLYSNLETHTNCFYYYKPNGRINGLYGILKYYDRWYYSTDLTIVGEGKYDVEFSEQWKIVRDKLKISDRPIQKNYKITVPEFMVHLKNNVKW